MEEWQVPLWDAINRYVVACGGDPGKHVYGNTSRMRAVSEVSDLVRKIEHGLHLDPECAWRTCGSDGVTVTACSCGKHIGVKMPMGGGRTRA